jgi:hypothetical protein
MQRCQWKSADLSPDKSDAGSPPFSIGTLLYRKSQFSLTSSQATHSRPPPSSPAGCTFALVRDASQTHIDHEVQTDLPPDVDRRWSGPRPLRAETMPAVTRTRQNFLPRPQRALDSAPFDEFLRSSEWIRNRTLRGNSESAPADFGLQRGRRSALTVSILARLAQR